jgi:putative ATP-dependent endonuclease of OLD family
LLTPFGDVRIADRVVIITDGDRGSLDASQASPGDLRKRELDAIASDLGASALFDTITNTYSLETELVRAGNGELLKQVYLQLHPRSKAKWDEAIAKSDAEQAVDIQALFDSTRKGDFAQILADRIGAGDDFIVPIYIECAIRALTR